MVSIGHGQTFNRSVVGTGDPNNTTPVQGAPAESFTYGADVGIGESDNVTLVSTDKVSQTIAISRCRL